MAERKQDIKKRVVTHNNLPAKFPFWQTIVAYLILDRFYVDTIWYNVLIVLVAFCFLISWLGAFHRIAHEDEVDVIKMLDDKPLDKRYSAKMALNNYEDIIREIKKEINSGSRF